MEIAVFLIKLVSTISTLDLSPDKLDPLVEVLFVITCITLVLCLMGVGIFALPLVGFIWFLYFASSISIGGGIALAGIALAAAFLLGQTKRKTSINNKN